MGCTHSKKNSKISSDKPTSKAFNKSASNVQPKSVQISISTSSSERSSIQEEKDNKVATDIISTKQKNPSAHYHQEKLSTEASEELPPQVVGNIDHLPPHPCPREAAREAARAVAREAAHEAAREAAKEARRERRRKERRRSRPRPQPLNTFWDQEEKDFIVRKNIQRNQRRIHAMQDRDETDDTLFEIPMRMPEVDFTRQTAVVA